MFSDGVIFAVTHLLTRCKSQYITGIKSGRTATVFSQGWVPGGEKVWETLQKTLYLSYPWSDSRRARTVGRCRSSMSEVGFVRNEPGPAVGSDWEPPQWRQCWHGKPIWREKETGFNDTTLMAVGIFPCYPQQEGQRAEWMTHGSSASGSSWGHIMTTQRPPWTEEDESMRQSLIKFCLLWYMYLTVFCEKSDNSREVLLTPI